MLKKGVVTYAENGLLYVWSKEINGEAVLDLRKSPVNANIPGLGSWLVFSSSLNDFVGDYTEIPAVLPTEVNEKGNLMIRTRISFPPNDVYRCDLLAYSKELGTIGIFQNYPILNENCEYDVWVKRVPQTLSNLERLYNAFWFVCEPPQPVKATTMVERFPVMSRNSPVGSSPNNGFDDSGSDVAARFTRSPGSSSSSIAEMQERREQFREPERTERREPHFFNPVPCTSTEETEQEEDTEEEVVGVVTSTFNRIGFVWASQLGEGIIPPSSITERIKHGDWIKFKPSRKDSRYLTEENDNDPDKVKYIAKNCYIIDPVYPTTAYKTTVSILVKLFVPQNYRPNQSDMWAEFFGTVYDNLGRIAEFGLNLVLGKCVLVRIMKMKNNFDNGNKWVVHKVLRILGQQDSVPALTSASFAADSLRYMVGNDEIRSAMESVDPTLAENVKDPHLLSENILRRRV